MPAFRVFFETPEGRHSIESKQDEFVPAICHQGAMRSHGVAHPLPARYS
jgi:hypothetical protein